MAYRVMLAEDAERDIEDLYRYIAANDFPANAMRVLAEIESRIATLTELPERGHVPKELMSVGITEYREAHYNPYRIIYRVMGGDVVIYCVVDGRRDMQSLLERRLLR